MKLVLKNSSLIFKRVIEPIKVYDETNTITILDRFSTIIPIEASWGSSLKVKVTPISETITTTSYSIWKYNDNADLVQLKSNQPFGELSDLLDLSGYSNVMLFKDGVFPQGATLQIEIYSYPE